MDDDFTGRLNEAFRDAVRERPKDTHGRPYSQNKLEKGAGLNTGEANRYLHGSRGASRPSLGKVKALAEELGVRWQWLLDGELPKHEGAMTPLEDVYRRLEKLEHGSHTPAPPESASRPSSRPMPAAKKST